jgi:hypothetical protein
MFTGGREVHAIPNKHGTLVNATETVRWTSLVSVQCPEDKASSFSPTPAPLRAKR